MTASLRVDGSKLREGLKMARKIAKSKQQGTGIISFAAGKMKIEFQSMTITADADGEWPGQARIPLSVVPLLTESIPGGDGPLVISIEDGQLNISGTSIPCLWEASTFQRIQVPLGAPPWYLLALKLKHGEEDIGRSGLTEVVEKAQIQCEMLIEKSAATLRPLGIDEADIRRLFESRLKEKGQSV